MTEEREISCKYCSSMIDPGSITCPKCEGQPRGKSGYPLFAIIVLGVFFLLVLAGLVIASLGK